jgi:hypothetical protein
MTHILRHTPAVKMVMGVPMDKNRVMANPQATDDFYAKTRNVILGVSRVFRRLS